MPLLAGAPAWAAELALAFESGAHSQFIVSGNVGDRMLSADGKRLVPLTSYLQDVLLASFGVVFSYDLGNGLRLERGREIADEWSGCKGQPLPKTPRQALELVGNYLRYLANLRALRPTMALPHVACILRSADQVFPGGNGWGHELAGLVSLARDWAGESPYVDLPFASLLITHNLADLHPLLARNPLTARVSVALPDTPALEAVLRLLQRQHPSVFSAAAADLPATAATLTGVSAAAAESLVKRRAHQQAPLTKDDLLAAKKALVEDEASNLVEFIESTRTLDDYHGQPALKAWVRQDAQLWKAGDLQAMPMGYLICGPVGTGKTYLVECLAGEIGVPVVKLKNFRDKWVGSSEGNLETIFRLVHALGRCMVFIDEADQALGKRDAGGNDGGLSGRLYSMIAQEMSDTRNRGRILWLLASSRPDLIEVDLKRPGRIDVKIPLLPTATKSESLGLLRALCKRRGLVLDEASAATLEPLMPLLLTPGAAEALAVKAYRTSRTSNRNAAEAIRECLEGYQAPVPADVMEFQMRIAVREASDLAFVPERFRPLAGGPA